jgi:ATP-dependent helicase/nuclease subunit B
VLRVTDHKTGKARAEEGFIVGGGEYLQPVLYGLAVEQALGRPVASARLFYCTAAGGFTERAVALGPMERRHGLEVLEIIDRAVGQGFLAPVPREGACQWCDFRDVCGPNEELRAARKPRIAATDDLEELRKLP